jgi:tetratricopeptide (TPR) repeat protein
VRQRRPDSWVGHVKAAQSLCKLHRTDEAEQLLQESQERLPDEAVLFTEYAAIAAARRDWDEALRRLELARERLPHEARLWAASGRTLMAAGQSEAAVELLSAAAQRFPTSYDVAMAAMETFIPLRELDRARPIARAALQLQPANQYLLTKVVTLDLQTGHANDALELWRSRIESPNFSAENALDLTWSMFQEVTSLEVARPLLRLLGSEEDSGDRDWLPRLAGLFWLRHQRPEVIALTRELVQAGLLAEQSGSAIADVLRYCLDLTFSDDDIHRMIAQYVGQSRIRLATFLFSTGYWVQRQDGPARVSRAFEAYLAECERDPSWISEDNADHVHSCLYFAAAYSHDVHARLLDEIGRRLDTAALYGAYGLRRPAGILATINVRAQEYDAYFRSDLSGPAIASSPRKLRVALCVSGQLRGFRTAFPTWSQLGLEHHETTIFVHTWQSIGRNWSRMLQFLDRDMAVHTKMLGDENLPFVTRRYPSLVAAASSNDEASEAMLRDFYGTMFVRVENDQNVPFSGKPNLWKMYYKMDQAHRFALEDGRDFDLVIRARPDRVVNSAYAFDPGELVDISRRQRAIFIVDHPNIFCEGGAFLGDQFAFGTRPAMDSFCQMMPRFEARCAAGDVSPDLGTQLWMHRTAFLMNFYDGLLAKPVPGVEFGALTDAVMLTPQEILSLIRPDIAARGEDNFDRRLIELCEAAASGRR